MTGSHEVIAVTEPSQTAAARFLAHDLARTAGFHETDIHRAGLVTTELATNLVKHAQRGQILARITGSPPDGEVELVAIDRGPGMRDVARCLVDGHSTTGSPGTGLGAVQRLSDTADLFSDARGTVVLARVRSERRPAGDGQFDIGAISVAKQGERVCGDAWAVRRELDGLSVIVADGLGHGIYAAEAAQAALQGFRARRYAGSADALQAIHDGMRHTRGAAVAIAGLERRTMVVRYAGIGNIAAVIGHDGALRQAVSHSGTLGHDVRVFREYTYPWYDNGMIVMHSDGLGSHWSLNEYRGLPQRHPTVIASVLYRDYTRERDDVTVVVAKEAA